ncbi:hypothetical protein KGF54_004842 [Candida jiufengensis]|uniref:uncharacterized protein n=1 Tax=Candida jiufengensis TaxID=497108 RepID=UPI0022251913|nr:uncharacterized protein KGF54_004842 [Candida jiufengensis]KAI5951767.1 hypothetical protein KGF54_004842 [Candida jiufengensis]
MGLLSKRKFSNSKPNKNRTKKQRNSRDHHRLQDETESSFQSSISNYTSRPSEDRSIASGPSILNMTKPKSNTVHRIVSPINKTRNEIPNSSNTNDPTVVQSTVLNDQMVTPKIIESQPNGIPNRNNDFAINEFNGTSDPGITQDPGIAINIMRQSTRETENNHTRDNQGQYLQTPNQGNQSSSSNSSMNNTSQNTQPTTVPPEQPKESGGIISFLTAAANKMSSTAIQYEEKEKKKDHSLVNKIDNFIKSVKHEDTAKTPPESNGSATTQQQVRNSNELKSLHSAQNVQFEPIRESPLNTLGNGDLTLDDFVHSNNNQQQVNPIMNNNQTIATNVPQIITNESPNIHRNVSPEIINKTLPHGNQLQATSNGSDVKRVHRLSINGQAPERQLSNGRSSILDSQVSNSNGNTTNISNNDDSKHLTETRTKEEVENTSSSENEDLDNVIDYSKKIKHAPEKENEEFHSTFKKIPKKDKLIEEISCALSKDILVQGKMYLSDHYVCFNSNILGWIKHIVIPLSEVIQIEKKSTAGLFPNGMVIKTLHQKYTFASIIGRDTVFSLITNVWHRVLLESSDVDPKKLRKAARSRAATVGSMSTNGSNISSSGDSSGDEASGGSGEDDDDSSGNESDDEGEDGSSGGEKAAAAGGGGGSGGGDGEFKGLPLVGPSTHEPTETGYEKSSDETFIAEDILKAPPGVIYLLLFGSDTSYFIRILKDQKNFDIDESEIHGLTKEKKDRHYTYTKPLGGSIGPKQTKCIIDDHLIEYNPDKYYEIEQTTQTPDVPSGNSFKVKTKIFLSWAEKNQTKIYVLTSIEWSGKSWIKGAIEKGTIDGQKDSMKDMIETLNSIISEGGSGKKSGGGGGGTASSKRRGTRSKRNTEKKQEEIKPKEEPPKGILDQILVLCKSIGELIPIPMIDSTIVGIIILVLSFFIAVYITNKINHLLFYKQDDYKSKIYCDAERDVWEWIISRSNEKLTNP